MIDTELLTTTLGTWGLPWSEQQLVRWTRYIELLIEWNGRFNLVANSTLADPTRRHLLDSLVLATAWPAATPPSHMADVGAGAGLPGLPLAILWPDTKVTLIESIGKKTSFLSHVAKELGLNSVTVLSERAEVLGHGPLRERCDLVVARAVAHLATLAEYCLPLCRVDGWWFAPKGPGVEQEVSESTRAINHLGGTLDGIYDVLIPDEPTRALVQVRKTKPTPRLYPRAVGVPARKPL